MKSKNHITIKVSTSKKNELLEITTEVRDHIRSFGIETGICSIFVPHTTSGITINENADPSVKSDVLMSLDNIVKKDLAFTHSEGNSPAHVKSILIGNTQDVFISEGQPVLGIWQGIYFCEFDGPCERRIYLKIRGC